MKRLATLVLAGLVLAGCGGSGGMSKSDYQARLQADGKPVQAAVKALTSGANVASLAGFAAKADTAEAAVQKSADDLSSIKPPKAAAADNAAIVAGLRAIQTGLEQLKKTAVSGGALAVLAQAGALEHSAPLTAAQKAIADLKRQGYSVGFLGL
jgi:hypothetical protein